MRAHAWCSSRVGDRSSSSDFLLLAERTLRMPGVRGKAVKPMRFLLATIALRSASEVGFIFYSPCSEGCSQAELVTDDRVGLGFERALPEQSDRKRRLAVFHCRPEKDKQS